MPIATVKLTAGENVLLEQLWRLRGFKSKSDVLRAALVELAYREHIKDQAGLRVTLERLACPPRRRRPQPITPES